MKSQHKEIIKKLYNNSKDLGYKCYKNVVCNIWDSINKRGLYCAFEIDNLYYYTCDGEIDEITGELIINELAHFKDTGKD